MSHAAPEISVVAPIHNEEKSVLQLFAGICSALEPLGRPFEVIFVNDASTDSGGEVMDEIAAENSVLRPIHLEDRVDLAAALSAGFAAVRGEIVLTLDGNLRNNPADLPRLLQALESGKLEAVNGCRKNRRGPYWSRMLPSQLANAAIRLATGVPIHDSGCGLRAYRAHHLKGICLPYGFHLFTPAVFGVKRREFGEIEVEDHPRMETLGPYGGKRLLRLAANVLAYPYLRGNPRITAKALRIVLFLAMLAAAGCLALALGGQPLLYVATGALALTAAYAFNVRRTLELWCESQENPPYRVRAVQENSPSEQFGDLEMRFLEEVQSLLADGGLKR